MDRAGATNKDDVICAQQCSNACSTLFYSTSIMLCETSGDKPVVRQRLLPETATIQFIRCTIHAPHSSSSNPVVSLVGRLANLFALSAAIDASLAFPAPRTLAGPALAG